MHGPIVAHQKVERITAGAPPDVAHRTIESERQEPRFSATRRNNRQLVEPVRRVLRLTPLQIGDPLSVGAPFRPSPIGTVERRDGLWCRTRTRIDDIDIGVVLPIRVAASLADECDLFPIWRPAWAGIVEGTAGDLLDLSGGRVEDVHVRAPVAEVAGAVTLECVTVDHDRLRLARRVRD
jgi:hypothetical protein